MDYPPAPRADVVEVLHGVEVADPYRWLEDPDAPRTRAWGQAQDALARGHLDALPGRGPLRERLRQLFAAGSVSAPSPRGGRAFLSRRSAEQEHAVLLVREADGGERTLIDPSTLSDDDTVTLDGWVPSIEGRLVAYWTSERGDEEASLWVLDVDSGKVVDGPIDRTRYCPLAWLPGGEELLYGRRLAPGEVPAGEDRFHRRVWRHRLGGDPAGDELVFGEGRDKTEYHALDVSRDGRWLVIGGWLGTAPRNDLFIADLTGDGAPRPVQEGADVETWGGVEDDGLLWLRTNRDAPRYRLVVADPRRPGPEHWRELVGESDAVLEGFALTDDAVVVAGIRHAVGQVRVHDRATGRLRGEVALPGPGSVTGLTSRPEGGDEAWIGWTGFTTPPRVYRYTASAGTLELWARAPGEAEVKGVLTTQETYRSADGTVVRMFVLRGEGVPADGGRPAVLYGYGGFDVPLTPVYSPQVIAWVERGGTWAVANLRGGSEEGETWHRAGMREHKQNVFDDFHAAAEHLVAAGHCRRGALGIAGGSNGGLLVGAALTQRPELYRAVVCSAPLLDMLRYERFGLGETWNDEYGRAEDPVEFRWLLSYSPYHRVRRGAAYPAVLFTVFESDTRVDPMHARKLCAALQWASASGAPVLLRRELKVGHGARSVSRSVELHVDTLAFLASELGLDG
ncbi:MAG TPA: prolyl oligopeptidase family serine peptidase [Actinomycetes bacterium]|nr:prolyl oligopeptidase family serine peptidase [Actinomycetes bacterium]